MGTQTNAILRYLGRKYQLEGKTEVEKASCDMMLENAMDFRNGFVRLSYSSKEQFDETKPTFLKNLEPKLGQFPNLVEFIKRMENLPRMADFLKSDRSPVPMN